MFLFFFTAAASSSVAMRCIPLLEGNHVTKPVYNYLKVLVHNLHDAQYDVYFDRCYGYLGETTRGNLESYGLWALTL